MSNEIHVTIVNRLGLHARPAARFSQLASGFTSNIWLFKDGKRVDAKSILEVLTLACPTGSRLTILAEGPDELEALTALQLLIERGFAEYD